MYLCSVHQQDVKAHTCHDAHCLFYMHFPGSFNDLFINGAPHIFDAVVKYLDHNNLVKARQVCLRWREVIDKTHALWQNAPWHPLHMAAALGRNSYLKELIAHGADIEVRGQYIDEEGFEVPTESATPLLLAAHCGHNNVLHTLIQAGADVNASSPWYTHSDSAALEFCLRNGNTDGFQLCLDHDASTKSITEVVASEFDFINMAQVLVTHPKFNINAKYPDGSILVQAAHEGHVALVELLLQQPNIDLETTDILHRTALRKAVEQGREEVVQLLLSHGSNPNKACAYDRPYILQEAVYLAIWNWPNSINIVKLLLEHGAQPDVPHDCTHTPLNLTLRHVRRMSAARFKEIITALLKKGAFPNQRNEYGETPLQILCSCIMNMMDNEGIDPDLEDLLEFVEIFRAYGANPKTVFGSLYSFFMEMEDPTPFWQKVQHALRPLF